MININNVQVSGNLICYNVMCPHRYFLVKVLLMTLLKINQIKWALSNKSAIRFTKNVQKQPPEVFYEKRFERYEKFCKTYRKRSVPLLRKQLYVSTVNCIFWISKSVDVLKSSNYFKIITYLNTIQALF